MTRDELVNRYLDWMYQLVVDDRYTGYSYHKLFDRLYNTEFTYIIPMDANRADDGVNLRYRFGCERRYKESTIRAYLDDRPCSVLEMMIALAVRCEEHIMDDPDIGNRTGQWFWNMIVNLGLGSMDDRKFDSDYVDGVLVTFLFRQYAKDGKGGLFTVKNYRRDMRNVEIWYQLCWYLNEL